VTRIQVIVERIREMGTLYARLDREFPVDVFGKPAPGPTRGEP
jgi:hypothetical protein